MSVPQDPHDEPICLSRPQKGDIVEHYLEVEDKAKAPGVLGALYRRYFQDLYGMDCPIDWRQDMDATVMIAERCKVLADAINTSFSIRNHPIWNTGETGRKMDLVIVVEKCAEVIEWRKQKPFGVFSRVAPKRVQRAASVFKKFYDDVLSECPKSNDDGHDDSIVPRFDDWIKWIYGPESHIMPSQTGIKNHRGARALMQRNEDKLRIQNWVCQVSAPLADGVQVLVEGFQRLRIGADTAVYLQT